LLFLFPRPGVSTGWLTRAREKAGVSRLTGLRALRRSSHGPQRAAAEAATVVRNSRSNLCRLDWLPVAWVVVAACATGPEPSSTANAGVTATQEPCDESTFKERCDGDVLYWCNKDHVVRQDCSAGGEVCRQGLFGPAGYCYTPCGNETEAGHCEGNSMVWCVAGARVRFDCDKGGPPEAPGALCAWVPEACSVLCLGCGDLPTSGRCTGDRLERCQYGSYASRDCAKDAWKCEVNEATHNPGCVAESACDPTTTGCHGQVARWCDGAMWMTQNCAALGLKCTEAGPKGLPACTGCDVAWWDAGCHFGWRKVCLDNVLVWEPCKETCNVAP